MKVDYKLTVEQDEWSGGFDWYCINLMPHPVDLTGRERSTLWRIKVDAVRNFGAKHVNYKLFFNTEEMREKFLVWMKLKWT